MPPSVVLFIVTAIWGSSFVVNKHIVRTLPPLPYLTLRYVLAAVVLLLLFGGRLRARHRNATLVRDGFVIAALNAAGLIFQTVGQLYTTASKSAFITSLYMPLVPLVGALFYKTRSTGAQLLAVSVASIGLAMLTFPSDGAAFNPGDLLTCVSAAIYAVTIIETTRRAIRHDSKTLTTVQVIATAACFAVMTSVALAWGALHPGGPSWAGTRMLHPVNGSFVAAVLYMAVICTVFTFLMQNWALSRMHVTQATIIFSLEAPVGTLIGLLADGAEEWPGWRGAAGGLLMLVAVALSQRKGPAATEQRNDGSKVVSETTT